MSVLIKTKSYSDKYVLLEKVKKSYFHSHYKYEVEDRKDNTLTFEGYYDIFGVMGYSSKNSIDVDSLKDDVIDLTLSDSQIEYLESKDVKPVEYLYTKDCVGGYSGGSCWGGEATYHRNDDLKAEFTDLDEFLEKIFPDISFLKYKSLKNTLVKEFEHCENEYYGNSSEYVIKFIVVKDMLEFLGIS